MVDIKTKKEKTWVEQKFPYASKKDMTPTNLMTLLENKKCPICGSKIRIEFVRPWKHKKYICTSKDCVFELILTGEEERNNNFWKELSDDCSEKKKCKNCLWEEEGFCKKRKINLNVHSAINYAKGCEEYLTVEEAEKIYREEGKRVV